MKHPTAWIQRRPRSRAAWSWLLVLALALPGSLALAGEGGVAATAHPLATEAANEMMARGGNAVDAAVAAAFAIGVVEPDGSGIGGGGGMLVYLHDQRRTVYINYYPQAPADPGAISYSGGRERDTAKSALVPGAVAGLCQALRDYGTLPLPVVLAPAIRYAAEGFPVDAILAGLLLDNMESLSRRPEMAAVFMTNGFPKMEGELLQQPELAHVLELVAAHGPDGFYRGETAERLVAGVTAAGGAMTLADLAAYEATVDEPLRGTYRGLEVVTAPAPHSGATLLESLNMLEHVRFEARDHFSSSARDLHLMAEVFRRTYADRSQYLGDPRFMAVPSTGLVAKAYAAERFAEVNPFRAEPRLSRDVPYGFPGKFEHTAAGVAGPSRAARPDRLRWDEDRDEDPGSARQVDDPFDRWNRRRDNKDAKGKDGGGQPRDGEGSAPEAAPALVPGRNGPADDDFDGGSTTHLSVIDADSNMVALTQTLGNFFGSKTMVNGILLNNGRANFSTASPANLIGPNKRPRSSITPTLVFRDGRPLMSLGSPGAGRIIATVAQVMVNIIDFGMDVEAANQAPRFFAQKFDEHLYVESRVPPAVVEALKGQGHEVRVLGDMDLFFGGVQIAAFRMDGRPGFVGSADKRRGGTASVLGTQGLEAVPGD